MAKILQDVKEKSKLKSPTRNDNTEKEKVNQLMEGRQPSELFDLEDTDEPKSKKRKMNKNLQLELKLKAKTENEKVNRVITEKSVKARDREKINCWFCDRPFARMNMAKHCALMHFSPTKVVQKKKTITKKRKMAENNLEDEQFNKEDYFIDTKPSEIIKNDGCKSCDKKPRKIEKLLNKLDTGTGYILPNEKN